MPCSRANNRAQKNKKSSHPQFFLSPHSHQNAAIIGAPLLGISIRIIAVPIAAVLLLGLGPAAPLLLVAVPIALLGPALVLLPPAVLLQQALLLLTFTFPTSAFLLLQFP